MPSLPYSGPGECETPPRGTSGLAFQIAVLNDCPSLPAPGGRPLGLPGRRVPVRRQARIKQQSSASRTGPTTSVRSALCLPLRLRSSADTRKRAEPRWPRPLCPLDPDQLHNIEQVSTHVHLPTQSIDQSSPRARCGCRSCGNCAESRPCGSRCRCVVGTTPPRRQQAEAGRSPCACPRRKQSLHHP